MAIQDLGFGEVEAEGRAGSADPTAHRGHEPAPPERPRTLAGPGFPQLWKPGPGRGRPSVGEQGGEGRPGRHAWPWASGPGRRPLDGMSGPPHQLARN